MVRIKLTIKVQNRPAKWLYVQRTLGAWGFGIPTDLYITDGEGRVRDERGQLGMHSPTTIMDVRILAQNPVARMVRVGALLPVFFDRSGVENGEEISIDTADEHFACFRILEMAIDSYEQVHRHFEPFSAGFSHVDFPFGRCATLEQTRNSNRRIDIVYPDNLGQTAPFVEPKSLTTGYPLLHLKDKAQSDAADKDLLKKNPRAKPYDAYNRLFGFNGQRAEIIPHELAHALQFALLKPAGRKRIEQEYLKFLVGSSIRDGDASHNLTKRTVPLVALIEAFGAFSERASAFVSYCSKKNKDPTILETGFDHDLAEKFIEAETREYTGETGDSYWLKGDSQIAQKLPDGRVTYRAATFTGLNSEGAVYGAIFLDFAHQVGMQKAVKALHESEALNFTEYHAWVKAKWPHYEKAIDGIRERWDLVAR